MCGDFAGKIDQVVDPSFAGKESPTLVAEGFDIGQPVQLAEVAGNASKLTKETFRGQLPIPLELFQSRAELDALVNRGPGVLA